MSRKWISSLFVGLLLPVFIISAMFVFCSNMVKMAKIWEGRTADLSSIQQFLLTLAAFFAKNFIFLALIILILCLGGAVAIALISKDKRAIDKHK